MAAPEEKRKRADHATQRKRIQRVLDLIKLGYEDWRILDALMQQEGIHEKTARRYLKQARCVIGGLGSQPSTEEMGELAMCLKHIQAQALSRPEPDLDLALQVVSQRMKLLNCHRPQGEKTHDTSSTTVSALSAELENALERHGLSGPSESPKRIAPAS